VTDVRLVPFGSLLKKVIDNRGKTCPTSMSGTPLIATNCIFNNHLYPQQINVRYVDDTTYKTWFRGHPLPGDILFVLKGTPGRVAWVPDPVEFCIAQDMVAIRADEKLINPKYLFAVLRSSTIQQEIEGLHVGTLIPHFKKGDFDNLRIPIVDRSLQDFIGDQYFSLSLKIDLLHRQNKTLEAMAETLFRQWFVEEAQEDWEEGTLGDIVTVVSGTTPKTDKPEYWNGEYHWTSPRDVTNLTGLFLFDTERKITKRGLEQIGSGLLPTGSLLMSSRAPVGALAFAEIPVAINQGYAGIICDKGFSREFVYLWLSTNMDFVQSHANGSTFQEISKSAFRQLGISIPDSVSYLEFHSSVIPAFAKIKSNSLQIRTLEALRDTLLPKLMSGEVRVAV